MRPLSNNLLKWNASLIFCLILLFGGCSNHLSRLNSKDTLLDRDNHYLAAEFFILGNRYYYEGNKDLAFEAYLRALSYEPQNVLLRGSVASSALESGEVQIARKVLGGKLSSQTAPEEWRLWGKIYLELKDVPNAKKAFEKALLFQGNDIETHYALGL
jgi:tetratricopeptide (TPR) repeat protein